MMTLPTNRKRDERGVSLIEVLVAIILFGIFSTIVTATVIQGLKTTRTSGAGVISESQLNDALGRIAGDVAISDPILYTTTGTGFAKNGPTVDDVTLQTVRQGKCTRVRYWVDSTNPADKALKSTTQTYPTSTCPDPRLADTTVAATTKTIVDDLTNTDPVFTYYTKTNGVLSAPLTRNATAQIARVQIAVAAAVRERPNGVRLTTSVAPRSAQPPVTGTAGVPSPTCPSITAADTGFNTPVVVRWTYTPNSVTYTLRRNGTIVSTQAANSAVANYSYSDSAVAGTSSVYTYALTIDGAAGSTPAVCSVNVIPTGAPAPAAPVITLTMLPNTSTSFTQWGATTQPSAVLSWSAVANATSYQVYSRPLVDGTFVASGTGTFTLETTTTSTSFTDSPGFDIAYEYYVTASNSTGTSGPSNLLDGLTQPVAPNTTLTSASCTANSISWTLGGATTDGYTVYERANGTTTWAVSGTLAGTLTRTFTDSTPPANSSDYMVVANNSGPRGSLSSGANVTFHGLASNAVTASSVCATIPANPVTTATGTELFNGAQRNPDGRNTASWNAVTGATSYTLRIFESATSTTVANIYTGLTSTSFSETGLARGSRRFYMATACNSAGCSSNQFSAPGNVVAYQRPNTPSTFSVTSAPSLASNDTSMSFTRMGDAGEPTDKFCASGSICSYAFTRPGATGSVVDAATSLFFDYSELAASPDWGATKAYTLGACNPGGCSNHLGQASATASANHYPGPFNFGPVNDPYERHLRHWAENGFFAQDNTFSNVTYSWTASAGVRASTPYTFSRSVKADDLVGRSNSNVAASSTSYTARATPGAAYNINVTSYAPNGLSRAVAWATQTPAPHVAMSETTRVCKEAVTDGAATNTSNGGWKILFRFKRQGYAMNDAANTTYGAYADYIDINEIASKVSDASSITVWQTILNNNVNTSNSTDASWPRTGWTSANRYILHGGVTADNAANKAGAMSANRVLVQGGLLDDPYRLPAEANVGGVGEVRARINNSGNHVANVGTYNGFGLQEFEFTMGDVGCSGNPGWAVEPGFVSRFAHPGSPAAVNPNPGGFGATG